MHVFIRQLNEKDATRRASLSPARKRFENACYAMLVVLAFFVSAALWVPPLYDLLCLILGA